MLLRNIPRAIMYAIDGVILNRTHPLPLLPTDNPLAVHVESVASDTATAVTLTGKQLIEVTAEDYGVYVRRTTAEDTAACTASNFHHYVSAGSTRHYGLKDGATGLSLIGKNGTSGVTIIEY